MRKSFGFMAVLLGLCTLSVANRASAGPVEALNGIFVDPKDPKSLALRYFNGGGGLLLSSDQGKSFRFLCNTGANPQISRDTSAMMLRADGSLLLGVFDGLWSGDKNACGFARVKSFEGKWVNDFALDPIDPTVTYAITSSGAQNNGIYKNDGKSAAWSAFGSQDMILIGRLHVVALPSGKRRFYQSAVRGTYDTIDMTTGQMVQNPKYIIRVSNDDGKTWTEHAFGPTDGTLRLVAVDPDNPDQLVASVVRGDNSAPDDAEPDDLVWSATQGSAGSFKLIGQVTIYGGVAFLPDGRMFYGDISQNSKALYEVAKLGDKPKQLRQDFKAGCLTYDAQSSRLYACSDRLFGTIDPKAGTFSKLYDMSKADAFAQCKGQPPAADRCQEQLLAAYCGITHFPSAAICAGYHLSADAGSFMTTGSDAAVSSSDGGAQPSAAGKSGGGGGCAVSGVSAPRGRVLPLLCLGACILGLRRRHRRRRGAA